MTEQPLVVFDFDGVLSNSFHDSLWMAINTYIAIEGDAGLPVNGPLRPEEVFDFEKQNPAFTDQFYALMPLGNLARDYYVILHIMTEGEVSAIKSQADYDAYKAGLNAETVMAYDAHFYAGRACLQAEDPQAWAALIPMFDGVADAVATLSKKASLAIATSKDRGSVLLLLERYGLRPYFRDDRILDKDFAPSKRQHLIRLSEATGTPFSQMHFIDDKVLHLVDVADLGVNAYLAQWGFNTPREAQVAQNHGCHVLKLAELSGLV